MHLEGYYAHSALSTALLRAEKPQMMKFLVLERTLKKGRARDLSANVLVYVVAGAIISCHLTGRAVKSSSRGLIYKTKHILSG